MFKAEAANNDKDHDIFSLFTTIEVESPKNSLRMGKQKMAFHRFDWYRAIFLHRTPSRSDGNAFGQGGTHAGFGPILANHSWRSPGPDFRWIRSGCIVQNKLFQQDADLQEQAGRGGETGKNNQINCHNCFIEGAAISKEHVLLDWWRPLFQGRLNTFFTWKKKCNFNIPIRVKLHANSYPKFLWAKRCWKTTFCRV